MRTLAVSLLACLSLAACEGCQSGPQLTKDQINSLLGCSSQAVELLERKLAKDPELTPDAREAARRAIARCLLGAVLPAEEVELEAGAPAPQPVPAGSVSPDPLEDAVAPDADASAPTA